MIEDGDSRLHFGFDNEILKQRARHDALIPIEVRMGINRRTVQTALRVASEAHLRMTLQREHLEQQFDSVRKVMIAVAAGLLSKGSDYSEAKGHGHGSTDALLAHWLGWGISVKHAQLDMGIIQDIILVGKSIRDIECERGIRRSRVTENLIEALKLW